MSSALSDWLIISSIVLWPVSEYVSMNVSEVRDELFIGLLSLWAIPAVKVPSATIFLPGEDFPDCP